MKRIAVAVTGASGAIYALRTLRALLMGGLRVDLIASEFGWMLIRDEGGFDGKRDTFGDFLVERYGETVREGDLRVHQTGDLAAPISSGSVRSDGMVVVPCWTKAMSSW